MSRFYIAPTNEDSCVDCDARIEIGEMTFEDRETGELAHAVCYEMRVEEVRS
jgi:hypothetical protein